MDSSRWTSEVGESSADSYFADPTFPIPTIVGCGPVVKWFAYNVVFDSLVATSN